MRTYGQLLGITGVILTLYGFLALAFTQQSTIFFYSLIGLGSICLLAFITIVLTDKSQGTSHFKAIYKSRSLRAGTNAVVYTILIVGILILANMAAHDFHKQWDLTENKVNVLSEQSEKILKNLQVPIEFVAFFDDQNKSKPILKNLLDRYVSRSKNVSFRFADPDRENQLAAQFGARDGDLLAKTSSKSQIIKEVSEQGITQALLNLTRESSTVVCFSSGHGELDLEGSDQEEQSLSLLKQGMTNEGYETKIKESLLDLTKESCPILVIAGPIQAFTPDEASAIDRYLGEGGQGIFLLDPNLPNFKLSAGKFEILPNGLEKVLEKWGVTLGNNFLLEQHLRVFEGMRTELNVIATQYGNHPIVEPMKGKQTVYQNVRSVTRKDGFDGTFTTLVQSASEGLSWAETAIDDLFRHRKAQPSPTEDLLGPVSIGAAVEVEKDGGVKTKLVVVGDSDFISNGQISAFPFNFDLFVNTLSWLQGEEEKITIRPKLMRSSAIELTPEQSVMIFYVSIISIPMIVLIFGMNLWWWRRKKG